jgi:hypothetical protein
VPIFYVEGLGPVTFPDEMSEEEIRARIQGQIAPALRTLAAGAPLEPEPLPRDGGRRMAAGEAVASDASDLVFEGEATASRTEDGTVAAEGKEGSVEARSAAEGLDSQDLAAAGDAVREILPAGRELSPAAPAFAGFDDPVSEPAPLFAAPVESINGDGRLSPIGAPENAATESEAPEPPGESGVISGVALSEPVAEAAGLSAANAVDAPSADSQWALPVMAPPEEASETPGGVASGFAGEGPGGLESPRPETAVSTVPAVDAVGFPRPAVESVAEGTTAYVSRFPSGGPAVGVTIQEYLQDRIQDQIDWYERKSASAQSWFKGLRSLEILSAAAIPLLSGYTEQWPPAGMVAGALGALVAALAGLLALYQHQERWRNYRGTAEALKREKFLFLARSAPYDSPGAFPRLVQTVEGLLAEESGRWTAYTGMSNPPEVPAGETFQSGVNEAPASIEGPPPDVAEAYRPDDETQDANFTR